MSRVEIECAIARYWPDIERIIRATGATRNEVDAVVAALEEIEHAPRREHDCAFHVAGDLACYEEHNCRCLDCKAEAQRRADVFDADERRTVELRAHVEYERQRRTGKRINEMPAWVRAGERSYQQHRRAS